MLFIAANQFSQETINRIAESVHIELNQKLYALDGGKVFILDNSDKPIFGADIFQRCVVYSAMIPNEIQVIILKTIEDHFSKMEKMLETAIASINAELPYYSVA